MFVISTIWFTYMFVNRVHDCNFSYLTFEMAKLRYMQYLCIILDFSNLFQYHNCKHEFKKKYPMLKVESVFLILNYQLYKGLIHFLKTSNSKMNRDKCSYLVLYKEISLNFLLLYSAPYIDGTALCTKCKAHNEYFNIKTSSLLH